MWIKFTLAFPFKNNQELNYGNKLIQDPGGSWGKMSNSMYLFFAWGHVVIKSVDDRTMSVYDFPSPFYIEDEPIFREEKP